ncbi:hypothetical protein [Spiroplasma endosymbiont of Atherix ibis]|uniref:hypothetical protein n=1 Tax=Spiroplasma endosymbiont of Atherix ibis TaxID=3066291 RepID=UPI0030D5D856
MLDRLDKHKTELANNKDIINNISVSLVENEELVNKFEEKLETKFTKELDTLKNQFKNLNNLLLKSIPPIIRVPLDFGFDEDLWELIDEPIKMKKLKINPKDIKVSGKLSDANFIYEIKNVSK